MFTEAKLRKGCQAGACICGLLALRMEYLRQQAQLAAPCTITPPSAMRRDHLHDCTRGAADKLRYTAAP